MSVYARSPGINALVSSLLGSKIIRFFDLQYCINSNDRYLTKHLLLWSKLMLSKINVLMEFIAGEGAISGSMLFIHMVSTLLKTPISL